MGEVAAYPMPFDFLHLRSRSLLRGNLLVLGSLIAAFPISGFPHNRITAYLLIPTILAILGTCDTLRCLRLRWSLYHGTVLLCLYMDVMALTLILFFLLYPYMQWFS